MRAPTFLGLVTALLLFPSLSFAQTSINPLTLTISPQYPGPYDTVTVTPQSTLIDLSKASLVLYVNGKQITTSSGGAAFTVPMQGSGTSMRIEVTASVGGKTYDSIVIIRPAAVALALEPISTTHPFYPGLPLLASEGRARIVAVPDLRTSTGIRLDPTKLSYLWRLGDQQLQAESGIGKSVLTLGGPVRYRDATVSVTVSSIDGSLVAQNAVVLSPVDPLVRLYHNDPLKGPSFNQALGSTYAMSGEEDSFVAVPYFFSIPPVLAWDVSGTMSGTEAAITLRTTGAGSGTATLSATATGANAFETALAQTVVSFSNSDSSSSIFGL